MKGRIYKTHPGLNKAQVTNCSGWTKTQVTFLKISGSSSNRPINPRKKDFGPGILQVCDSDCNTETMSSCWGRGKVQDEVHTVQELQTKLDAANEVKILILDWFHLFWGNDTRSTEAEATSEKCAGCLWGNIVDEGVRSPGCHSYELEFWAIDHRSPVPRQN